MVCEYQYILVENPRILFFFIDLSDNWHSHNFKGAIREWLHHECIMDLEHRCCNKSKALKVNYFYTRSRSQYVSNNWQLNADHCVCRLY